MASKQPHFYCNITRVDEDERMVWGYGTREDMLDSYGTIIDLDSVRACLPDYLKWRNVREMHQPSAVGTAEDVTIDETGVMLGVHVVDDAAWAKVKGGVYKGFSIGGKKDYQDGDRIFLKEITEFSLVDRPANPGCTIDEYRLYGKGEETEMEDTPAVETPAADVERFAGEEICDVRTALEALEKIQFLVAYEKGEQHPEAAEQVASLSAAIEGLKKFIASEIKEITAEETAPMQAQEIPLMELAEPAGDVERGDDCGCEDVERKGASISAENMGRLNNIRDALRDMGVTMCERCAREADTEMAAGEGADVERAEDPASTINRLQGEADVMRAELDAAKAEIARLQAEPEAPKGVARVVSKEDDSEAVTRAEDEAPRDATSAIRRLHAAGGQRLF